MIEPSVTINGMHLNVGQSMTVRVALSSFLMQLKDQAPADRSPIDDLYERRLAEIFRYIEAKS